MSVLGGTQAYDNDDDDDNDGGGGGGSGGYRKQPRSQSWCAFC